MAGLTDNTRGALLMVGAMTAYTLNDTCMKALGDELPLMQAMFLRGLGVSLILLVWVAARGELRLSLPRTDRWRLAWRTVGEVLAAWLFLTALFEIPIANAIAILQTAPLAVALGAALFLGEPLGWRRFSAILIGFVGVLVILRPGTDGFEPVAVLALLSVLALAMRDLMTRRMGKGLPSLTVALIGGTGVAVFSGIASLGVDWAPVSPRAVLLLTGSVVFILGAYVFSVQVMRVGDIGFVAPFRYTSLVVALIAGLVVFGDWPDGWTLLGSAIVVVTGLFTLYRERLAARTG
ncbi:MAG: DMT family transporter [Rhodobacteraceae bacterium]|nr:DMT family transporter [Paracoccaceae bacterium]